MLEIPVKLIVKAPNQQVEDQTIHCDLSWTIKRLKGYLSEVYPSKPNTEDQRLIYYGQLLNDSVTLEDIFTRYEAGEETHTVHLVCMPSKESLKMQARKIAEENSRKAKEGGPSTSHRSFPAETEPASEDVPQSSSQCPPRNPFQPPGYQHWMNTINSQSSPTNNYIQQWMWLQQVYANYYMNQYMDMIARQNGVALREGYETPGQAGEAARNQEPQVARDVDDEDNRLNRDWLDYFYTFSRLLVLLSIVYFYSSPIRFFIVSSLGMALYLYQIGFFRVNQPQAVENNNEAVNNNVAVDNNNLIPEGEVAAEVERAENPRPEPEPVVEVPEQHLSFVALTLTFLTSFFSSMIPETQNGL